MTPDNRLKDINVTCSTRQSCHCPSHPSSEQPRPSLWLVKFPACCKNTLHHRYMPMGKPIILMQI
jgi:hypothetical protein